MDSPEPVRLDEDIAWSILLALRGFLAERQGRAATVRLAPDGGIAVSEGVAPEALLCVDADGGWSAAMPKHLLPLFELYLPLCRPRREGFTVGHLGQSLDGRIATASGASRYVNGPENLLHLHRLRALADAVVVGAGTVSHDDPRLTVRNCPGHTSLRVVIDTECRLADGHTVFQDAAAPTLLFCADDRAGAGRVGQAERIPVPRGPDGIDLGAATRVLAERGAHVLFVEGGGITMSRFLQAGLLDRLQITVAPVLIGSGRPGITLPEIETMDQALRPRTRWFPLGQDVLFECIFRD